MKKTLEAREIGFYRRLQKIPSTEYVSNGHVLKKQEQPGNVYLLVSGRDRRHF